MTLAEHQAANPDYDVWQGGGEDGCSPLCTGFAVYYDNEWCGGCKCESGAWYCWVGDRYIEQEILIKAGATFRRKKERKKEFVIEKIDHAEWLVSVDGEPISVASFLNTNGIKRARLVVEEWEK